MKRQLQLSAILVGLLSCMPEPMLRPVTQVIGPEGGRVVAENGVTVEVPPGALSSDVSISISTAHNLPDGSLIAVEIGPSGTQFGKPVTLSFPAGSTDGQSDPLKVMTVVDGAWVALPDWSFDSSTGLVSGTTTHLSPYGLVRSAETCGNELDDDGDELVDCDDPVCWGEAVCTENTDGGSARKCQFDKHCPSGEVCIDKVCQPGSSHDGGVVTDGGAAAPDAGGSVDAGPKRCQNNNQCDGGDVCLSGECTPSGLDGGTLACESDADCPEGMRCRGFRCK